MSSTDSEEPLITATQTRLYAYDLAEIADRVRSGSARQIDAALLEEIAECMYLIEQELGRLASASRDRSDLLETARLAVDLDTPEDMSALYRRAEQAIARSECELT